MVKYLNCVFTTNFHVKQVKNDFFIVPENDIDELQQFHFSLIPTNNGYDLQIKNMDNAEHGKKLVQAFNNIMVNFTIAIAEDDIYCELPKYLCKILKIVLSEIKGK